MIDRLLNDLTIKDLTKYSIWEMVEDTESGDVRVNSVDHVPVDSMRNRLVATQIHLADSTRLWALLGNVSPNNPLSTKHFLTVSIHHQGKWFDLARYHDVDYLRRNGEALAKFLSKPLHDIFPVNYDIANLINGKRESLLGSIQSSPDEKLSDGELLNLSLQSD